MSQSKQITISDKYEPTPTERRLLQAMLDPEAVGMSVTEVCKKANVSRQLYYTAVAKQGFQELLPELSKQLVSGSVLQVVNTFIKKAKQGSYPHGEKVLEMAGLISEEGGAIKTLNQQNNFINLNDEQLDQLIKSKLKQTGIGDITTREAETNSGEPT